MHKVYFYDETSVHLVIVKTRDDYLAASLGYKYCIHVEGEYHYFENMDDATTYKENHSGCSRAAIDSISKGKGKNAKRKAADEVGMAVNTYWRRIELLNTAKRLLKEKNGMEKRLANKFGKRRGEQISVDDLNFYSRLFNDEESKLWYDMLKKMEEFEVFVQWSNSITKLLFTFAFF